MLSLYTSLYNLSANIFDWQSSLLKFRQFADEVCVATTTDSKDNTVETLSSFCNKHDIKLIVTDIKFSDYAFDGKLKDAALKICTQKYCTLLDIDEEIPIRFKNRWRDLCYILGQYGHGAVFVPVIDLFHDEKHYKSLSSKWYLHKNSPHYHRGVVSFAKLENGKIDHTKSDTTELIDDLGNLVPTVALVGFSLTDEEKLKLIRDGNIPFVLHFGWRNREIRSKQAAFWKPVWSDRAGFEVKTEIDFDSIEYKPHGLDL